MAQLDKFIVGQQEAKKAVAIALRNRWRRHQMSDELKNEVTAFSINMQFDKPQKLWTFRGTTLPNLNTYFPHHPSDVVVNLPQH